MWSLGFLLIIMAFVVLSFLRIMPFYTEYSNVLRSVNQLITSGGSTASVGTIRNRLMEKFYQNDVRSINKKNFKQYITIKQTTLGKTLTIAYTRRAPVPLIEMMFDNLYYSTVFNKTFKLK